jgi:hypothetical protein
MLLGDLIARFDDDAVATETLLSLNDLAMTARIHEAAAREGLTPGEFAGAAVQHFAASASDEDWVSAIGQMARTAEPGTELLRRALQWSLKQQTVGCSHGRS